MMTRKKILFLCTGNSCRSQMAEGWARYLKGDQLDAYSAGIEKHGLNKYAVQVMAEAGVDISGQQSKHLADLAEVYFDFVITVCSHASEQCPLFAGSAQVIHVGFADPPACAAKRALEGATEEQQLDCYRSVRDEIKAFIGLLPESLPGYS